MTPDHRATSETREAGSTEPAFNPRRMSIPEMIEWIRRNGEVVDPRPGIDTESLLRRFPHLAAVRTRDVILDGPNGPLPGRIYTPTTPATPAVAFIWAHGGGFLGGNLDMPEANWTSLEIASRGVPVLSVDYTKCLGEVHFPIPVDDVLAWWEAAHQHSFEWLGVPSDKLVLGGASAGATLAAGAVQRMIDKGSPVPDGLVLVYPPLHPNAVDPTAPLPPESRLSEMMMNYAGSTETLSDPRAFPGLGDGSGFPPALVVACEHDAFVPSAETFSRMLELAHVDVRYHLEVGADHGHIDEPSDEGAHRTLTVVHEWLTHRASEGE